MNVNSKVNLPICRAENAYIPNILKCLFIPHYRSQLNVTPEM